MYVHIVNTCKFFFWCPLEVTMIPLVYNVLSENKIRNIACHGRTAGYPTAPAQIPACGTTAPGSSTVLASAIGQDRSN